MLPTRSDDTGSGWPVFDDHRCSGSELLQSASAASVRADGNADPAGTGAAFGVPLVFEGDRLAVKVIPGGAAVVATLHVWLTWCAFNVAMMASLNTKRLH